MTLPKSWTDGRDQHGVVSDGRALLRARQFFGRASAPRTAGTRSRPTRATGRPPTAPLAARPGRPLHPRRQLHRLLLLEDPRQGRPGHLGDPADRLPLQRHRHAGLRAARMPPRGLVLLVRLLAAAAQVSRTCAGVLLEMYPRGARSGWAIRSRPGRRSSRIRRRPAPTSPSAARAASCAPAGTRSPSWSPPPTSTRSAATAPTGSSGFSPIPAMSMVSYAAGTRFLSLIGGVCLSASTTGTPTCRRPRRRSGATRPTCPSRPTGGTPPT